MAEDALPGRAADRGGVPRRGRSRGSRAAARGIRGRGSPGLGGQNWTAIPTNAKVVALTFDAGANADGV